jgi:predicted HicB family RNase H-like nuclease
MTRIPEGLRRQLERAAARAGRSMNAEIISRLERSFTELQVRLSEGLERRLEQAAKDNDWSMNTEIFNRLDSSFQREELEKHIGGVIEQTAHSAATTTASETARRLVQELRQSGLIPDPMDRPQEATKHPASSDKQEHST